jgi:hypothetical protein
VIKSDLPDYVSVSDVSGANDNTIVGELGVGTNSTDNDFVDEPLCTISGVVLVTKNGTIGDRPLIGVVVECRFTNGTVVARTSTEIHVC